MLSGLVVLDLTRVLAGPQCTRLLADLGARVIKIERPGEGDEMRRSPAPLPGEQDQSTYFARRNAGKQSVGIDLSQPDGISVLLDIARQADVVVENFMPGVTTKLGCDYDAVRTVKADVVYCSISGFGHAGPDAKQGAFAHVVAAASGIMHLDAGDAAPRTSHLQAADVLAGTNAFGAILAALWRRERTGQGAYIDVSMLESLLASEDISYGTVPNGTPSIPGPRAGMGISKVTGRWIAWQSGGAPTLWPRLCNAMACPELITDERYESAESRRENWPAIEALVATWLDTFTNPQLALDALRRARIPCALVASAEEVVASEHLAYRQTFHSIEHPGGGEVKVTASPYWIDHQPILAAGPAPYRIGEHTKAVLSDLLGYDANKLEQLLESGAVAAPK